MVNELRQRIHRKTQDANSIGIVASASSSTTTTTSTTTSTAPPSTTLEGKWKFLNRSKIAAQTFHYTRVHTTVPIPKPTDGPEKWHPVCGLTQETDQWQSRGFTDGLGCAEEEDPSMLHPTLFGSLGGSDKAQRYNYSYNNTCCVDGSPLTAAEECLCQQFEGKWKGGFALPVSREHTAQVKETFTIRVGIGPGLVSLTRKKVGGGRRKNPVTTPTQIANLALLDIKKNRRAVSVLGRGRNEYGCFTLSGRLFLDTVEAAPTQGVDQSAVLGPHLESVKLYDEPLQKWKTKRKINIKGMRSPPLPVTGAVGDGGAGGGRRTKRARKMR